MKRLLIALVLVLSVVGCGAPPSEVDRFYKACAEADGFVANTSTNFWTERIDCIKDNRVIYLPGFA